MDSDTGRSCDESSFDLYGLTVLRALRRIIHAVDSQSSRLNAQFKVTLPQMLCLYELVDERVATQSQLVNRTNLGASTVNGIIDRLEAKGLVEKKRSTDDRRRVLLRVTDAGHSLMRAAPDLLHDGFTRALRRLPDLEQAAIALSLERVVELIEADRAGNTANR